MREAMPCKQRKRTLKDCARYAKGVAKPLGVSPLRQQCFAPRPWASEGECERCPLTVGVGVFVNIPHAALVQRALWAGAVRAGPGQYGLHFGV